MTELLPGVHVVDDLSGDKNFTTNVFLIKDAGATWTMIDAGLPGASPRVEAYLKAHRIEPRSIQRILLTHLHRDHTGGLKAAVALTGAKTYAHWIEAGFLAGHPPYDGPGAPPTEPIAVDEILKDGDPVDAGGGLIAYHTPGHTAGHTAYYQPERRILFSGDLFFGLPNGLSLTLPEYTLHTGTAQVSARRVGALTIESLMTYHGGPYAKGAAAHVKGLVAKLP